MTANFQSGKSPCVLRTSSSHCLRISSAVKPQLLLRVFSLSIAARQPAKIQEGSSQASKVILSLKTISSENTGRGLCGPSVTVFPPLWNRQERVYSGQIQ